jgi:hypothetical protein
MVKRKPVTKHLNPRDERLLIGGTTEVIIDVSPSGRVTVKVLAPSGENVRVAPRGKDAV